MNTLDFDGGLALICSNEAFLPPQTLKFANNVIVRIAGFNLGYVSIHHPNNAYNLNALKGWLKVAPTVFAWVSLHHKGN